MKIDVKNTLILIVLLLFLIEQGHAFDLDETVDDEIRKNYNPSKLVQDVGGKRSALEKNLETLPQQSTITKIDENLPALPNITKQNNSANKSTAKIQPPIKKTYTPQGIKISDGTSFDVVSISAISDWQTKGTTVKFTTKKPIVKRKYTIPASTVFIGEIIESHRPQITCNGGLIVIRINSMIYKGETIPIKAYITRADDKKIFLNNIKGDRTFLKTLWKKGNWGRTLFDKMLTLTCSLGSDGATLILAPFPLAYGTICLGANAITSPICAFFSKGGQVSIPAGSNFRIKLMDDLFL